MHFFLLHSPKPWLSYERRWNEKLERVTRLEQAYNQAEQEAEWHITPEERKAIKSYRRTCLRFGNPRYDGSGAETVATFGARIRATRWRYPSWAD
jgi:hypothetical protein